MPAATEIWTVTLGADVDIEAANGATVRVVKECYDKITSQNSGPKGLWYGTEHENPRTLQLFLNLENEADHVKASSSLGEKLDSLHTGVPIVVHVDFQPPDGVSAALSAPITEVATFYYDSAPPETAFEGAKTLIKALQQAGVDIRGWALGTTREVVEKDGARGKGNVLLVGWETVEAHLDSHNTQALKDNIHWLTTPEVKGFEMHHVQATAYRHSE